MSTIKKESAKKSTVKKTKEVVEEVVVNNDKLLESIEEVDTDPVPENSLIFDGENDFEEDTPTEEPVDYPEKEDEEENEEEILIDESVDYPEKEDCEGEDMTEKEYEEYITAHKVKEEVVIEKTTNKKQRPTKDNIESLLYGYGR